MDASPNKNDLVIESDIEDFMKLSNMEVLLLKELLIEQNLYDNKLNLVNSFNKNFM